jgi:hypothetical protein
LAASLVLATAVCRGAQSQFSFVRFDDVMGGVRVHLPMTDVLCPIAPPNPWIWPCCPSGHHFHPLQGQVAAIYLPFPRWRDFLRPDGAMTCRSVAGPPRLSVPPCREGTHVAACCALVPCPLSHPMMTHKLRKITDGTCRSLSLNERSLETLDSSAPPVHLNCWETCTVVWAGREIESIILQSLSQSQVPPPPNQAL